MKKKRLEPIGKKPFFSLKHSQIMSHIQLYNLPPFAYWTALKKDTARPMVGEVIPSVIPNERCYFITY